MSPRCLQICPSSSACSAVLTRNTQRTHVTSPMKKSSETFTLRHSISVFSSFHFSVFRSSDWSAGRSVCQPVVMIRWPCDECQILQREDETSEQQWTTQELLLSPLFYAYLLSPPCGLYQSSQKAHSALARFSTQCCQISALWENQCCEGTALGYVR